jgi:hypothetical protein
MQQDRFQRILMRMAEEDSDAELIWISTPELAKANDMAFNPKTRSEGIAMLMEFADRFPHSKNVCALVAQALAWDGRQDEAIQFIEKRFPDVLGE